MKRLFLVLAAAGLTGCAVYPTPAYEGYGASAPVVVEQPVYIQGGVYRYGGSPYAYPRGYNRGVFPAYPPRALYGPHPHGGRDRDRDGIANRFDRDRDGDGVPNRFDRAPNNPNLR
jgi:hypothetical protein